MKFPDTWKQLREDMKNCEQTSGQSILEHGQAVWGYYQLIEEILAYGTEDKRVQPFIEKLVLPKWFFAFEEGLAWNRFCSSIVYWYTVYHDLGKPYCRIVDNDGKTHYPDHAEVSYQVWSHLCDVDPLEHINSFKDTVAELIRRDMEIHTIKASDIEYFCRDKNLAITLLLVGLAEVHANANIFGGFDSPSFKIKFKQIERRGQAICKYLNMSDTE